MSDDDPTTTLHIYRYDFTIPRRYQAGHTLTEGEAKALNQLMTENIRNNVSSWVRTAEHQSPNQMLSTTAHEDLQTRIHSYATTYQFQTRIRKPPVSALEVALDELAHSQAEHEGTAQGYAPDSVEVQLRYRNLLNDPELKAQARSIVAERTKVTSVSLEEILGGPC